jgi:hypothetical protein
MTFTLFLVCFGFGVTTQLSHNYGADTGKMILANLGCNKPEATSEVKTTPVIRTNFIACYDQPGI